MTDVRLSEEQELLVDTCRRMVERGRTAPPAAGTRPAPDAATWQALTDAGLVALAVPVETGGGGASPLEVALVAEQLARGPVAVPYVGTTVALDALVRTSVAPSERDRWAHTVQSLLAGEAAGVVVSDDLRRVAALGVAVDAEPGSTVLGVGPADRPAGIASAPLPVRMGVAGAPVEGVDLARSLAVADLTDDEPLGVLDPDAHRRHLAFAMAVVCADLLGAMHAALDGAVDHACERVQFGQPVGSFQAVQHLCAEALVSVEAARSITWHAAWAVEAEDPGAALAAARVAKAYCSEVALEVVETAVQVWGGQGITWECPAHLHQRRVLLSRRLLGDPHHLLALVADGLLGDGSLGEMGSVA